MARRKGQEWYIGNAAGLKDWKGSVKLDFLSPGKTYKAEIWQDGGQGTVHRSTKFFKKGDPLQWDIKASEGEALILSPVD